MEECHSCGKEFKQITKHWSFGSSCDYPTMSERQRDILIGFLLGDGSIQVQGSSVTCVLYNTNLQFLEWVDEELGIFSNGIRLHRSGSDAYDYRPEYYKNKPNDYYALFVKVVPEVKELGQWYETGKKRFPTDLHLNSMRAKIWYCCDGNLYWNKSDGYCNGLKIAFTNESDRVEYMKGLFEGIGFDFRIMGNERIWINSSNFEKFFDWIGESVPGMEYKWEIENVKQYDRLMKKCKNYSSQVKV